MGEWTTNVTEPWTQNLLSSIAESIHAYTILELGCFKGITTACLALRLEEDDGGKIYAVDINTDYCDETRDRLEALDLKQTEVEVICSDAITAIGSLPRESIDFAFIDDKIDARHIKAELEALWSWYDAKAEHKMALGSIICVHDISHDDVASVVLGHQGYLLNTTRMHLHGGLGIIQIPSQ